MKKISNRRDFVKQASGLAALGLTAAATTCADDENVSKQASVAVNAQELPDNPLVLFDNFHVGNRHTYSWKSKFAQAGSAGFDGFEFAGVDPNSDNWKEAMELVPTTNFKVWGFHWTTRAVIDQNADKIDAEIEKIIENIELLGKLSIKPYYTLSLSGTAELGGPSFDERGSAKAQDRHWERAYKIIAAYDRACRDNEVRGCLYPHIDWICDTPQSAFKILDGSAAETVGPAFCSHHWYANSASIGLDEMLDNPLSQRMNYVVLTNGVFTSSTFQAVRFNEGQIDMAWVLSKLYEFGYAGPISSQGWKIGGDPYLAGKQFVDGINSLRNRFIEQPKLNPLI
jgi:sugar phosphate isomerase/epimerase